MLHKTIIEYLHQHSSTVFVSWKEGKRIINLIGGLMYRNGEITVTEGLGSGVGVSLRFGMDNIRQIIINDDPEMSVSIHVHGGYEED